MRNKPKFTPGPWHWVDVSNDKPYDFDKINERLTPEAQHKIAPRVSLRTVAEFQGEWAAIGPLPVFICEAEEITRGNAELIAAAPELYKAIIAVRDSEHKLPSGLWEKVHAAISKAGGKAP